jgi:two-component system chemotaxis response regulator CheB
MQVKVLVVDDSRFYRNRLCEILSSDANIQIVGTAENGREGVEKALSLRPDVITMDIEMPVMDGISAVREIMKKRPTPILMLSSLTAEGAQATLDALDAGAVDFLLKRLDKLTYKKAEFGGTICNKILALGSRAAHFNKRAFAEDKANAQNAPRRSSDVRVAGTFGDDEPLSAKYKIIVIGASTGGPVAVQSIMCALPANFPIPILVVQHMPGSFTGSFARRLDTLSQLSIKEAEDGDVLGAGKVYVAPGGKQLILEERSGRQQVKIRESYENEQYKPSVDVTYKAVSEMYGKDALAIILTGMGSDGRNGAVLLKRNGSTVWAQDEHTCIVFGMPQAVIDAGLADRVMPVTEIAQQLVIGA